MKALRSIAIGVFAGLFAVVTLVALPVLLIVSDFTF
ncbi:hypothetical protein Btus_2197 [Kyrpidia tusciae DSM 2912]|uniref:Uncharacterized protein n=1 Tax=Kyrpidia tusciae (strain DSM 2912 / NBRC 15312 / T2) TaxID=562970 RepID=D5WRE4_KYRT2|nr:hypothetical protein Btus_2197 [Kyrpidia tusciae DSM 2912]